LNASNTDRAAHGGRHTLYGGVPTPRHGSHRSDRESAMNGLAGGPTANFSSSCCGFHLRGSASKNSINLLIWCGFCSELRVANWRWE